MRSRKSRGRVRLTRPNGLDMFPVSGRRCVQATASRRQPPDQDRLDSRSLTVPVRHEIDVNAGRVVVHLSAAITAGDILGFYDKLAGDPAMQPGLTVLADCR